MGLTVINLIFQCDIKLRKKIKNHSKIKYSKICWTAANNLYTRLHCAWILIYLNYLRLSIHSLLSYTAVCKQSRRLLEVVGDNFLVHTLDKPTGGESLLDLLLTNWDELIEGVKIGGCMVCSEHTLPQFLILRNMGLAKRKVKTLNFQRMNFELLKDLVDKIHTLHTLHHHMWQGNKSLVCKEFT